jgi:hypothetical protein
LIQLGDLGARALASATAASFEMIAIERSRLSPVRRRDDVQHRGDRGRKQYV